MASTQRAFVQKINRQHAADVRKQLSSGSFGKNTLKTITSGIPTSVPLCDVMDPVDYEDFVQQHQMQVDRDPMRHLMEFPADDIEVCVLPRRCRTLIPIAADEECDLDPRTKDCIRSYSSDWVVVQRRYQSLSSSCFVRDIDRQKTKILHSTPRQEFEVDIDDFSSTQTLRSISQHSLAYSDDSGDKDSSCSPSSSRHSLCLSDTPRGSWASSDFDLRNSAADSIIPSLLERSPIEEVDLLNEARRMENRQESIFSLDPLPDEEDAIEKRLPAECPVEHFGHRILVDCLSLKLELEIEPIFAIMALYDAREKKKISENFYFDMNSEPIKKMLNSHVAYQDISTLSRACIFNITHPSPDIFIVLRLEKVLQGDIAECAEPYMKDDKNRDKVKANAVTYCERLGKYRMPFAWTAIYLANVISGMNSLEREMSGDKDSVGSNSSSLERKTSTGSFEGFRKKAESSTLSRRGSLERRSASEKRNSWSPDEIGMGLETFRPVTITVSSFFKQEGERLRDEDLYKYLLDLKRPTSVLKRLKCLPGVLKLDISPCPDEVPVTLTPELIPLQPYGEDKGRPKKEILEFPPKEVFVPHYNYRNLLYVYPKDINFANRPGSARNIACQVKFMAGEESQAMPYIFGKSSCPEFVTEAFTTVCYHNKCPDFYDEIKIRLPAKLNDSHHLLFTFYHLSCQKKMEQAPIETPIGYTWFPLTSDGRLQTGDFSLPVMLDPPPPNYCYLSPMVPLPNVRWVDNHKGLFNITISAVSSLHTQDDYLEPFQSLCSNIEEHNIPARIGEQNLEAELKNRISNLVKATAEPLVVFLPILMDKLIQLIVEPLTVSGQILNVGQTCFEAMALLVKKLSDLLDHNNDQHGRNGLLATYVQFQCTLPHPSNVSSCPPSGIYPTNVRPVSMPIPKNYYGRSTSNPDLVGHLPVLDADSEVCLLTRGVDRTSSMRLGNHEGGVYLSSKQQSRKIVHEELALQWVVSNGKTRELALSNAWFFFDLMVKSMIEHLYITRQLDAPRKLRFREQFIDDLTTLVTTITSDIISRYNQENKDVKFIQMLNTSLAFFLFDLLTVMDRGYVFSLIKTYCKQMSAKIASLPDAVHLINLKLEFIRIVCSHEHFVALNLPFVNMCTQSSGSVSPCPSVASSTSHSSFISTSTRTDKANFAELSHEFRQQHFLVGLILSDLEFVLQINHSGVHRKAVNTVRNLLCFHDSDPRYMDPASRARVAALYLPLIGIVMEALPQLFDWSSDPKGRPNYLGTSGDSESHEISHTVAMAIAGAPNTARAVINVGGHDYDPFQQSPKYHLNADCSRNLLLCCLWVMKNVEDHLLKQWLVDLSVHRLHQLLEVLYLCISCFEYKGKKVQVVLAQQSFRKTNDVKTKLEDVILGQGSARNELMRRRDRRPPSPGVSHGDRLRWRKDQTQWRPSTDVVERSKAELECDAHIQGNLATEVTAVVLDMLEIIVNVASQSDNLQGLVGTVFRVLLHSFSRNQSTAVLQNLFATQRSLVFKFPGLMFDEETEQCADLCLQLLRHCSSSISVVRAQSSASLYLLMRQNFEIGNNFARVKMQVTMSLSSLVGTSHCFSEGFLRRSLKTILTYAEEDVELKGTTFPDQVRDLVFNLHMILSDTVKMKEFQEDPEMLLDLMYRIAKGYQTSPDLRLTWLANMAQKHIERNNQAEAAQCFVHSAALVAEYLHMLEDRKHLPIGAISFMKLSDNVLEESAVSDDVVSPDEEGICTGKYFSENGLVNLLEQASSAFNTAGLYEAMNEVYKILIPIAEASRDFKKLASIHAKLHDAFTKIEMQMGKRVFGTYFRVGFYGTKLGDLDEKEFIYKEPTLTKLPEISHRLESFYSERYGCDFVEIIKDSNAVDASKLNPEKAYIQITYVEPYFDAYDLRERKTYFEKNFNIKRFIYATPFTMDGKAHGELHEQFKRKTILTTECAFPYVKTRILVVDRVQRDLTPIEVAIEDVQKKTTELAQASKQIPVDPKILQMVLQGSLGTTVNQGPLEVAFVFLGDILNPPLKPLTEHQNKLRLCFKDFCKKCSDALHINKSLIGPDQRNYQKELERNYTKLTEKLMPMLQIRAFHKSVSHA
ncbi:hypothetical protein CHUAL_009399 [Chamberlinius hualienensis]